MNFEAAVQYLLGLGNETLTMKLGLRNTELLLRTLDNPQTAFPSVQIAGTNGKGSVAAFLDSICRTAGIRTGLYTSPHLISMTERVKVDGNQITRDDFGRLASTVRAASEELLASNQISALPTFFEQVTAVALVAFRDEKIQLAILETGLGGRLDSTTAANAELVGISQIDFDHEEYLGNTIESIAAEKAAIIRPGVQAVIARQRPEALRVILDRCEATNVEPIYDQCATEIHEVSSDGTFSVSFATTTDTYEKVEIGLRGRHQIENASLAIQLAEQLRTKGFAISPNNITEGIETARHPGRLELINKPPCFLLDGAHNPAGARTLRAYLEKFSVRPLVLLFGAMKDKQLDQLASILFPVADQIVLTTVNNPRSASDERLRRLARDFATRGVATVINSSEQALRLAIEKAGRNGLICVTGSLYLIGELRQLILEKAMTSVAD